MADELPEIPKAPDSLKRSREEEARSQPRRDGGGFAHSNLFRELKSAGIRELFGNDITAYSLRPTSEVTNENPTISKQSLGSGSSTSFQNQSYVNPVSFQKITPTQISGDNVVEAINKLNVNLISSINNLGSISEAIVTHQSLTNKALDNLNNSFSDIDSNTSKTNIILQSVSDILDKQKYSFDKNQSKNINQFSNDNTPTQNKDSSDPNSVLSSLLSWGEDAVAGADGMLAGGKALVKPLSKLGSLGAKLGKNLPLLGDLYQGYQSYNETGSIGRGIIGGLGSLGGRTLGGALGSAAGPIGTFGGMVAGSEVGTLGATKLYDWMFSGRKETQKKVDDLEKTDKVTKDIPFSGRQETQKKVDDLEKTDKVTIKGQDISISGTSIKFTSDKFEFNGAIALPSQQPGINPIGQGSTNQLYGQGVNQNYGMMPSQSGVYSGRGGQTPPSIRGQQFNTGTPGGSGPQVFPGQKGPYISGGTVPRLRGPSARTEIFDQKAKGIMTKLMKDFNLSKEDAAAIMGNLGHESAGFSLMQEQNPTSGRGGWGWAQWTGPRRVEFENMARQMGLDPKSDEANYEMLKRELSGPYKGVLDKVRKAGTLDEKMTAFEHGFEKSGDYNQATGEILKPKNVQSRLDYTNRALALFNGEINKSTKAGGATDKAFSMLGMEEHVNRQNIMSYLKDGGKSLDPLTRSWCAAFVGSSLEQAGIPSVPQAQGGDLASSYLNWGKEVKNGVRKGDVVVDHLNRIDRNGQGGHVGLATGKVKNGKYEIISGNYGDRVGVSYVDPRNSMVRRWEEQDQEAAKNGVTPRTTAPPEELSNPQLQQSQDKAEQLSTESHNDEVQKRTSKQPPIIVNSASDSKGSSKEKNSKDMDPKVDEPKKNTINDRHRFSEYYDV